MKCSLSKLVGSQLWGLFLSFWDIVAERKRFLPNWGPWREGGLRRLILVGEWTVRVQVCRDVLRGEQNNEHILGAGERLPLASAAAFISWQFPHRGREATGDWINLTAGQALLLRDLRIRGKILLNEWSWGSCEAISQLGWLSRATPCSHLFFSVCVSAAGCAGLLVHMNLLSFHTSYLLKSIWSLAWTWWILPCSLSISNSLLAISTLTPHWHLEVSTFQRQYPIV